MSIVAMQDTFLQAYARIPKVEQKRIHKLIDALRANRQSKGLNLERVNGAVDPYVYSARLSQAYRIIVVRPENEDVYLLVWVDHHDDAYRWATRKRFVPNEQTRTLQMWDLEELDETETAASAITSAKAPLFADVTDEQLTQLGVINEFIPIVRKIQTLEDFRVYKPVFPRETYEYLEFVAQGDRPEDVLWIMRELERETEVDQQAPLSYTEAITSPTSSRTIMVAATDREVHEQLQEVLDQPLEQWRIFLHPRQKKVVERSYRGPVRVLGGAGTGKTVVAMHRVRYLIRHLIKEPHEKILFTTFTRTLAQNLREVLSSMCKPEEMERIEVIHIDALAKRIVEKVKRRQIYRVGERQMRPLWMEALQHYGWTKTDYSFLRSEYDRLIQVNGISSWEEYLSTPRVGRKRSISRTMRKRVWDTISYVVENKQAKGWYEYVDVMREARRWLEAHPEQTIFTYRAAVIDEAQDIHQEGFKLLRALIPANENDQFLVGDAHQRIYSRQVVLGQCGIHVRGRRSIRLNVNYRTTEQIRRKAMEVIEKLQVDDLDGGVDDSRDISLLSGASPVIRSFANSTAEKEFLVSEIKHWLDKGVKPNEIAVLVPTNEGLDIVMKRLYEKEIPVQKLAANVGRSKPHVQCGTMHNSKGLEFRIVFIAEAGEDDLPNSRVLVQKREDPDEAEAYLNEQRSLLYVAMTRAREQVYITSYGPLTSFLSERG